MSPIEYLEYTDKDGIIKCPYQMVQTSKFRYCKQEKCPNGLPMKKCGDRYNYCRTELLEDEVLSATMD